MPARSGFFRHWLEVRLTLSGGRRRFRRLRLILDGKQFDIKYEHPSGPIRRVVVGELNRDPEAAFFTDDHQLETFGPTGNDSVERGKLQAGRF